MNPIACFWLVFAILFFCIAYCNNKFCMLKELSGGEKPAYSWSRVQMAWWTVIVLSAFIAIMVLEGQAPELRMSTVILLGISAATIATARTIDTNEISQGIHRHQEEKGENFIIDILSDESGVSVHRFQTVVFNLAFGVWFISQVTKNLANVPSGGINDIMPDIGQNNLILLGLSSATYAVLKTTENKGKKVKNQANPAVAAAPVVVAAPVVAAPVVVAPVITPVGTQAVATPDPVVLTPAASPTDTTTDPDQPQPVS